MRGTFAKVPLILPSKPLTDISHCIGMSVHIRKDTAASIRDPYPNALFFLWRKLLERSFPHTPFKNFQQIYTNCIGMSVRRRYGTVASVLSAAHKTLCRNSNFPIGAARCRQSLSHFLTKMPAPFTQGSLGLCAFFVLSLKNCIYKRGCFLQGQQLKKPPLV